VVNGDREGALQLQEGARRFSHTRTERSRSAMDAGMRLLYRSVRLICAFENLG
jgi:hypothetical protein